MKTNILKIVLFSAIALLIFTTISCEKEDQAELPVDFKFCLLDTLGKEKTVFNQGENIIFSFEIINKTSQDVHIGNFFSNYDFFRVFQLNTPEGKLDYGVPYDHLFCEFIGAFLIPKNDSFKVVIPWYNDEKYTDGYIGCPIETFHRDVPKLEKGKYCTEFSQSFKIGENETVEKHFKINFKVQ